MSITNKTGYDQNLFSYLTTLVCKNIYDIICKLNGDVYFSMLIRSFITVDQKDNFLVNFYSMVLSSEISLESPDHFTQSRYLSQETKCQNQVSIILVQSSHFY